MQKETNFQHAIPFLKINLQRFNLQENKRPDNYVILKTIGLK